MTSSPNATSKNEPMVMADTFPAKAYLMITYCDKNDPTVACWDEEGKAFIVHDASKLSKIYLPKYFKHSKFPSLIRQLNLYGFNNIKWEYNSSEKVSATTEHSSPKKFVFRHENFHRGRQDLLEAIKRTPTHHKKEKDQDSKSIHVRLELLEIGLRDSSNVSKTYLDEISFKLDHLISIMSHSNSNSAQFPTCIHPNNPSSKRPRWDIVEVRPSSPVSLSDASEEPQKLTTNAVAKMDVVVEEYKTYENGDDGNDEFHDFIETMLETNDSKLRANQTTSLAATSGMLPTSDQHSDVALSIGEEDDFSDEKYDDQGHREQILIADRIESKVFPATIDGTIEYRTNESSAVLVHSEAHAEAVMGEIVAASNQENIDLSNAVVAVQVPSRRSKSLKYFLIISFLVVFCASAIALPLVLHKDNKRKKAKNQRPLKGQFKESDDEKSEDNDGTFDVTETNKNQSRGSFGKDKDHGGIVFGAESIREKNVGSSGKNVGTSGKNVKREKNGGSSGKNGGSSGKNVKQLSPSDEDSDSDEKSDKLATLSPNQTDMKNSRGSFGKPIGSNNGLKAPNKSLQFDSSDMIVEVGLHGQVYQFELVHSVVEQGNT